MQLQQLRESLPHLIAIFDEQDLAAAQCLRYLGHENTRCAPLSNDHATRAQLESEYEYGSFLTPTRVMGRLTVVEIATRV